MSDPRAKNTFSRRNFLRTGALATAAAFAAPPPRDLLALTPIKKPLPAAEKPPIRLGLASYTFRNFSRAQLIADMHQLQISALNAKDVKDHLPADPPAEAAALADYSAAAIQLHAVGAIYFPKDDDADIRPKFDYAKRAGVPVIVAGDPAPETLPRLEKFVREYDIRIAIHNHGPEDKLWPSPLDVLKALRNLDPRIGCCIDVGHAARAGTNVPEAIHQAGQRLFNLHMKDLTNFASKESQVAVGQGIMPVRKIFEALIATNYQGYVDLEYEVHEDNPMPGVIQSFAYMRGVLAGMGQAA
ncbi:MAG: sugar phosphate isomerase/epimerase [Candidatus Acidiferrales bacterium]